jgi:hypothetical protein
MKGVKGWLTTAGGEDLELAPKDWEKGGLELTMRQRGSRGIRGWFL